MTHVNAVHRPDGLGFDIIVSKFHCVLIEEHYSLPKR